MLYRKKPLIVEAMQWFPMPQEAGKPRLPERYGVRYCPPNKVDLSATRGIKFDRPERFVIDTLDGVMDVHPGDYIVKGIMGERYAVKEAVFILSYEISEKHEAHHLGIFGIDRTACWLRTAAVAVFLLLATLLYMAKHQ